MMMKFVGGSVISRCDAEVLRDEWQIKEQKRIS
jgi:hypothetical protein